MMHDKKQLEDAVARKIISKEQAKALENMQVEELRGAEELRGDDLAELQGEDAPQSFRLIGGFGDIFVAIGIVFFLIGLRFVFAIFLPNFTGDSRSTIDLTMMVVALILAEWITKRRRMKLPSLIIGVMFIYYYADIIVVGLSKLFDFTLAPSFFALLAAGENLKLASILFFIGLFIGAALYFMRYRLPFMAAPMAISTVGLIGVGISILLVQWFNLDRLIEFDGRNLLNVLRQFIYFPLFCGLGIFVIALYCDVKDRLRETTWSDSAFWLHLISAPMIVHPLYVLVAGQETQLGTIEGGNDGTWVMIILVALFTFTSLCIDRRALLIPSLGYFGGLGIYKLFGSDVVQQSGVPSFAILLLVVGALVILFGTGWRKIRRIVAGVLLPKAWLERLPPLVS